MIDVVLPENFFVGEKQSKGGNEREKKQKKMLKKKSKRVREKMEKFLHDRFRGIFSIITLFSSLYVFTGPLCCCLMLRTLFLLLFFFCVAMESLIDEIHLRIETMGKRRKDEN